MLGHLLLRVDRNRLSFLAAGWAENVDQVKFIDNAGAALKSGEGFSGLDVALYACSSEVGYCVVYSID